MSVGGSADWTGSPIPAQNTMLKNDFAMTDIARIKDHSSDLKDNKIPATAWLGGLQSCSLFHYS
jgi:hypothetical protein